MRHHRRARRAARADRKGDGGARQGYEASDALVKELQNHVKKTTAPYKYPRIVEFVTELPKTISGKIRRVEIRENDSANR